MMPADLNEAAAPAPDSNPALRRLAIAVKDNPRPDRDYMVSMRRMLTMPMATGAQMEIQIRYVPDRLICLFSQMEEYFKLLARAACHGIEELANSIADDFCNEVIPCWLSVDITLSPGESQSGSGASVHVEDRQPHWDNPSLLQQSQRNSGKSSRTGLPAGQIKSLR